MTITASSADMPTWAWAQDDLWAQGPPCCRVLSHDWLFELLQRGAAIPCACEAYGVCLHRAVALHAKSEVYKGIGASSAPISSAWCHMKRKTRCAP